jgi:protein-disulfide isomerase
MAKSHHDKHAHQLERERLRDAQRKDAIAAQKRKKTKRLIFWIVPIVIIVAILISFFSQMSVTTSGLPSLSTTEVASTDQTFGTGDIIIIEYSDFQCPACKSVEPLVNQLKEEYGEDITFVYRHFPLKSIHRKATYAAQASEAAALQGKFWEMNSLLFDRQSEWVGGNEIALFEQYAEELTLDVTQFKTDINSEKVRAIVQHNYNSALALNLGGTPTFFIDGKPLTVRNYESFVTAIETAKVARLNSASE